MIPGGELETGEKEIFLFEFKKNIIILDYYKNKQAIETIPNPGGEMKKEHSHGCMENHSA